MRIGCDCENIRRTKIGVGLSTSECRKFMFNQMLHADNNSRSHPKTQLWSKRDRQLLIHLTLSEGIDRLRRKL